MANYRVFSNISEVETTHGRVSVITTDACSCINLVPDGINIDVYQDGEKVEEEEQYFDTLDVGDDILDADMEKEVYVHEDAEGIYNAMLEHAQIYRDVDGNLDRYSEILEERMLEGAEDMESDEDEI